MPTDDRPRVNGLPVMSKRRWAEFKAGKKPAPRKPLRSKPKARSKAVAAYMAMHPHCELTTRRGPNGRLPGGLLDWLDPPGWREFKRVWSGHELEKVLDPHHVFGSENGDHVWNLIVVRRPAHDFVQGTRIGRLVCVAMKVLKGEYDEATVYGGTGMYQIGAIENDRENGIFTGRCLALADAVIAWNVESEPPRRPRLVVNGDRIELKAGN